MVTVRIRKDGRERLSSIFASGHAGWAESGEDVVCAAVSAILQAALLGLMEVATVDVDARREDGRLAMSWPERTRDDAAVGAIVATAALSIERIAMQYPDHVHVIHERERVKAQRSSERADIMSDVFKPISDANGSGTGTPTPPSGATGVAGIGGTTNTTGTTPGTTYTSSDPYGSGSSGDAGKTVMAGVLGGLASAVGYIIYSRLPDDQRDRLHQQVRTVVESRVNELRGRFNI